MSFGGNKSNSLIGPESFQVKDLKIHSVSGISWDVSQLAVEMNIFESLFGFSVEYEFAFVDTADMFNNIGFTGDERITFTLVKMTEEGRQSIEKECYIMGIPLYGRETDSRQIFTIRAISKHAYIAAIHRISKKVYGSPSAIIKNLIEGELNTEVTHFDTNSSGFINALVPYMTINETIMWVMKRAHNENGSPFFIYETLLDGIHIESYDTMKEHIAPGKYIVGGIADTEITNKTEGQKPSDPDTQKKQSYALDFKRQKYRIRDITSKLGFSKLKNTSNGSYASNTLEVDIHNKKYKNYVYSYDETSLLEQNSLYDDRFVINDRKLVEYVDAKRMMVHKNTNLFNENLTSYNDNISAAAGKMNAFLENMDTMSHVIEVAGDINVHPGMTIEIVIPAPVAKDIDEKKKSNIDKYMSGKYLVMSIQHRFDDKGHIMSMKIKRDSTQADIKESR